MTWDSNKQAFAEPEPPLTYNRQISAWQDTEGYEHNSELGAWEKVWPRKLYIIKDGVETQNYAAKGIYALNHDSTGLARRTPDITRNTSSIVISQIIYKAAWFYGGIVVFGDATYDLNKFKKLCVDWSGHAGSNYGAYAVGIYPSIPPNNGTLGCITGMGYTSETGNNPRKTDTVDISDITDGIVGAYVNGPSYGVSPPTTNVTIYNLWLE